MANDNITAETPHHAECLRLIQDLHDILRLADSAGLRIDTTSDDLRYAYDFRFWADECAKVLGTFPAGR
jgi:hypothetical protein